MANKFTKGDTVKLKSGGSSMTVKGYEQYIDPSLKPTSSDTEVVCIWHNKSNEKQESIFHEDELILVK